MISIDDWILGGGYIAIGATVFAESGLLIGFFLPGDTLLFGAGILASQGVFNLPVLIGVIVTSAIIGNNVGYSIGRKAGPKLFKSKSALFRPSQLESAEQFYEKHGGKTIILARFLPVIRTFAPMIAGMSKMSRRSFMLYNVIGAIIWGAGVPLLGYFLGKQMPWLENFITPVILGIIILSIALTIYHLQKEQKVRRIIFSRIELIFRIIFPKKTD